MFVYILGIPFNQMQLQTANTMKAFEEFSKSRFTPRK